MQDHVKLAVPLTVCMWLLVHAHQIARFLREANDLTSE